MGCGSSSRAAVGTSAPSSPAVPGPDLPNDVLCASSSTREPDQSNKFGGGDKLHKLAGGTLQHYHDNLKCLSGLPAPSLTDDFLLKQMKAEHCYMTGYNEKFDCSLHYEAVHPHKEFPTPETSAKEEWEYAVDGKVPNYIASGNFRLKELYAKDGRVSDIYRKTATVPATGDPLSRPERLGLALYTGPMFKVYNSILRWGVMKSSIADKFLLPIVSQREADKPAHPSTTPYPSATPCFGSYAALQSVYASAQRLKLEIFERFDRNGDLCIEKKELNDVIHKLLSEKSLDDNMLRALDYFSALDQNHDNIVDFDEALKYCFPYVPNKHLDILKKWLHPEKYDKALFEELTLLASKTTLLPNQTFQDCLKGLERHCKDFVEKSVKKSEDNDRVQELEHVNQGFVSELTLASILSRHDEMKVHASGWKDKNKSRILQCTDNTARPNLFSTTIFAISSAIQTLSRLHNTSVSSSAASSKQPKLVYRGYKDVIVPENFPGYCELGFLSASKDKDVAEKIASQNNAAKSILILEIKAPIGGFADIREYSQFPQEQEFMFAPLTYIKFPEPVSDAASSTQRSSDSHPVSSFDSVSVPTSAVAPTFRRATVFPSPASTVEDMQKEEQSMHLQLFRFNRAELSQKLENRLNDWLSKGRSQVGGQNGMLLDQVCKECDEKWMNTSTLPHQMQAVTTKQIFERILSQYDEVFENHRLCKPEKFANDDFFREKVSQMLNSKRWCEHKLSLWIQNCENNGQDDMSIAIYFHPLDQCFKMLLMTLRRSIMDMRREGAGLKQSVADSNVQLRLKKLCADLLQAKGLISSEFDFSKDKELIVRVLGDAAVNGWGEEDLFALLDLCHDVESVVVERMDGLSASCLHLAAAHGNSFFLSTVFSYLGKKYPPLPPGEVQTLPQSIVHCQSGNAIGETPLYLAAENGHSSCIEVLIKYCPEVPEYSLSPLAAAVSRSHVICVQLLLKETATRRLIHSSSSGFTPLMRAISRGHVEIVRLLLWAGADAEVQGAGSSSCKPSQPAEITVQLMLDQKRHGENAENSHTIIKKLLEERKSCPTLSGYKEQFPQVSKFFT